MSKSLLFIAAVAVVACLASLVIVINRPPEDGAEVVAEPQVNRRMTYSLAVKNTSSKALPEAKVWIRGPNKGIAGQTSLSLQANYAFTLETDPLHNQVLAFAFTNLPPYSSKILTIDSQLAMQTGEVWEQPGTEHEFLNEEPYIETSNMELQKIATQLAAATPEETARNICTWVSRNVDKTEYNAQPRGARYALKKRKGDCTEFMHLFVALCRINQIPSRCVNGYVISKDSHVAANDLHDWAQVYVAGRWHLADPFYNTFMEEEQNYVAMQVRGNSPQAESFYRWKTDSPHLAVKMLK